MEETMEKEKGYNKYIKAVYGIYRKKIEGKKRCNITTKWWFVMDIQNLGILKKLIMIIMMKKEKETH